jgi:heparan-alpha-glucosaminide N-acetyltransferase
LVTGGGAFLGLSLFYYLVDAKKFWGGFPFLEPGVNCLAMYVGSRLTANLWPWHWSIGPMDTHFILLLDSVWACALWLLTAKWLYRRKIFVSV